MDIPNACVAEMPIHKGPVLSVRFNHSGDYCISCGADRVVKLLNPHKGLLIKTYRCTCLLCGILLRAVDNASSSGHSQDVRTAVASHDNSRLASGGNDRVPMVRAVAVMRLCQCAQYLNTKYDCALICCGRYGMWVLAK